MKGGKQIEQAIPRKGGVHIGKGGGYSDLEYALLRKEEKIGVITSIVTTVHPLQVVESKLPMTGHDIPLNAIITPEEMIPLRPPFEKPVGIHWDILPEEKIADIPVFNERKNMR